MQVAQEQNIQVEEDWQEYNNCILVNMLTADITNFTNWSVIRNEMFSTPTKDVLEHLQSLPDWDDKWKDAIKESPIGNPLPCEGYPQSSGNVITHALILNRFLSVTNCKLESLGTIFEFGGGYGCMCRLIHRLGFSGEYVSFDLPALLMLQRYYLGEGTEKIHNERGFEEILLENISHVLNTKKGPIAFLSDADEFTELLTDNRGKSLFIACWSISEAPISLREKVLRAVCANTDYIFISFQSQHREFNNLDFFTEFADKNTNYRWSFPRVQYLRIKNAKHLYLFGERIK